MRSNNDVLESVGLGFKLLIHRIFFGLSEDDQVSRQGV
jgi:hypothetical protein